MKVIADNKATEKALKKLVKTMQEHGAWFHEDITLTSENNGLRVDLNGPCNPTQPIMNIPANQLVPVKPLHMDLKGDDFVITPDEKELSPLQIELGEQQIEIYNLTERPALHRGECAWIRFRDNPDLLEKLLRARTLAASQQARMDYTKQKDGCPDDGEFLCDTFWQSRVLGHKLVKTEKPVQKVMPFVDYLDHHHQGSPFLTPNDQHGEPLLRIQNQRPFLSSSTVYASYGMYDALDTFITYGFIDTETPFVRAVPMTLPVEDGADIRLNSMSAAKAKEPLNKQLKDLKPFSPMVGQDQDGSLRLSHLHIPCLSAPNSLRRLLRAIVQTAINDKSTPHYAIDKTYQVERLVVGNTIDFYRKALREYQEMPGEPDPLRADCIRLCEVQLAKLYKYFYNENFFTLETPATAEAKKSPAMANAAAKG